MLAARAESKQWFLAQIWFWTDTNWFSSLLPELPAVQQFLKMIAKQPLPHMYSTFELLDIRKTIICLLHFRTYDYQAEDPFSLGLC